ncbi:MAG: hypothetical protein WCH99_10215 [Verrucomicrobiota bacterium]
MNINAQINVLNTQADHYHNLAKEIALDLLNRPDQADAAKRKHTAQMHLIRAESFRTAVKLISGTSSPSAAIPWPI